MAGPSTGAAKSYQQSSQQQKYINDLAQKFDVDKLKVEKEAEIKTMVS